MPNLHLRSIKFILYDEIRAVVVHNILWVETKLPWDIGEYADADKFHDCC